LDDYEPEDQHQETSDLQPPPETAAPTEPSEPLLPETTDFPEQLPPEDLNPWISFIYRPRDTIRYLLHTGAWNNPWILYAIVFVVTLPGTALAIYIQFLASELQGNPSPIPANILYGSIFLGSLILGYPIGMLFLYIKGWLNRIVGS
jgi:hypothetical protein